MKIENVMPSDAGALLEIYAYYVEERAVSFEYEVPGRDEFAERIRSTIEKYPYIKAVSDEGKVLGYAYAGTFKGRRAYDRSVEVSIYVDKDAHGLGAGRMLYEALETRLKAMGILNTYACIAMPKGEDPYLNDDSRRFHEHMGFVLAGRFHDCAYKFGRWYDMIWMEKMIGAHLNIK